MESVSPVLTYSLVSIYAAELFAFSICILILRHSLDRRIIALWLIGNLLAGASVTFVEPFKLFPTQWGQSYGMLLILLSTNCRYLALSPRNLLHRRMRVPNAFAFVSNLAFLLFILSGNEDYRLLLFGICGFGMTIAICLGYLQNPLWRGLQSRLALIYAFLVASPSFLWRIWHAYPLGTGTALIGESTTQVFGLSLLIAVCFFVQLSFIVLMRDRTARDEHVTKRRLTRTFATSRLLEDKRAEMEKVFAERSNLLNILTHEIRQPLNNAQAALQGIMTQLSPPQVNRHHLMDATGRAQAVLDDVTLALSNAIVGATVIERGAGANLCLSPVLDVAHLAMSDCPPAIQTRIRLNAPQNSPFVELDPVLLRLALRNLLDNAGKYSPAGSPIHFDIILDEERCGILFRITSTLLDPRLLEGDIFARNMRATSAEAEGKGLGLFIVKQVTRIHRGAVRQRVEDGHSAIFELFIPD